MKAGVVVIGRNEGERLRRCLESVIRDVGHVVYVDSASTDDSVAMARAIGADVIDLDMRVPFCAARARNAGYERIVECHPELRYVQFIDGDCEIVGGWLAEAIAVLDHQLELAIVAGWLHERFPGASIYNRLGDLEWNSSEAGEVESAGGIFMIRCEAFDSVGGFDPTVPAGEEPELCQRLIRQGWRIHRLDRNMALHDLAMIRFSQWWTRMTRFGYGSMDVAYRFGLRRFRRNNMRAHWWMTWFATVSIFALLTAAVPLLHAPGLLLTLTMLSLWPAQMCRVAYRTSKKGQPFGIAAAHAFFTTIAFLPQTVGHLMYWNDRLHKKSFRLVEYKAAISLDPRRGR